uniref:Uncharacterized protein n=1 Tax=Anguilla anguilla TaxID=7936 RepID=A0A0E9S2J9_ANGAN
MCALEVVIMLRKHNIYWRNVQIAEMILSEQGSHSP